MTTTPKILIVDDKVENLVSLEKLLAGVPVVCVRALSGNEALSRLLVHEFALVLMDVHMPEMDGFETVEWMRQDPQFQDLPVIFLSAVYHGEAYKIRGVKTGGIDFLNKPIVPELLEGKVKIFLELYQSRVAMQAEIEKRKASEAVEKQLRAQLQAVNADLEKQVDARTAELRRTNQSLKQEIKERIKAEASLKAAQSKLIETEKVAALGTLTAGIAHELNNPLMGILNFIQYCRKKTPPSQKIHDVLGDAQTATEQCIEIVRNLLTFARVKPESQPPLKPQALATLFKRVLYLMAYRIEKEQVEVDFTVDENMQDVPVRATEMQQVFLNLFANALDAVENSDEKRIAVHMTTDNRHAEVSIADSGGGIDETNRSRIFDPFFTTKPVGKGTGLGLSVSKGIVDAHHGRIECRSRKDKGTCFHIYLELAQEPD